jgi:hypothetical protein
MMDETRVTVTRDGLSTPVGVGGLLIGPSLSPQPVRNNTATTEPSLFTDFPLVSLADPAPAEERPVSQPVPDFSEICLEDLYSFAPSGDADYWPSWPKSARHSKIRFPNAFIFSRLMRLKMAGLPAPQETPN